MSRDPTKPQLNHLLPVPITLEDHTTTTNSFSSRHITDVLVADHHIIEGDGGRPYIVWQIRIILNNSNSICIYKRFSDIEQFRKKLVKENKGIEIPALPPKDNMSLQRMLWTSNWVETRRRGLQWFMTNVMLNPRYGEDAIREFVLG